MIQRSSHVCEKKHLLKVGFSSIWSVGWIWLMGCLTDTTYQSQPRTLHATCGVELTVCPACSTGGIPECALLQPLMPHATCSGPRPHRPRPGFALPVMRRLHLALHAAQGVWGMGCCSSLDQPPVLPARLNLACMLWVVHTTCLCHMQ